MIWRARQFEFRFPGPVRIMGIVNVTPDSFSDGGRFLDPRAAEDRARQLVAEGADIIDIGGESTRPNAAPVSEEEELRRVLPVMEKLSGQIRVPLSIDTTKPSVARACLAAGASIVNDVGANREEAGLWEIVAEFGAGYVAMHMQGTPQTMQRAPHYADVVEDVGHFFAERLRRLRAAGVEPGQTILDVGIGFGKSVEHNLQLLAEIGRFTKWDRPLLLGVSRKSFIGSVTEAAQVSERLPGSLACACWAATAGVNVIRTHDVAATRQAIRMLEAILARRKEWNRSSTS